MAITGSLKKWREVQGSRSWSVLIGNGFSIALWNRFAYAALFKIACSPKVSVPLLADVRRIFRRRKTINFEEVLDSLATAAYVDHLNGAPSKAFIECLRKNTRTGLASALQWVHVPPCRIDLALLCKRLKRFRAIYTTNYDLTLYWTIFEDTSAFADFLWSPGTSFDPAKISVHAGRIPVLFLHGGLHLREDRAGANFKVTAEKGPLLDQLVRDLSRKSLRPLIITEGTSVEKMQRIQESPYLKFALDQLREDLRNVVVLGQSLSHQFDAHLIEAINEHQHRCVAVGMWKEIGKNKIVQEKARLHESLKTDRLVFFDVETHPLYSNSLRLNEELLEE